MKSLTRKSLATLVVFIALTWVPFARAEQVDFSADTVMNAGGQVMQGRIYVSGQKSRMETAVSVVIVRPDLNLIWMVMPEQKMYMEQPLDPERVPLTSREMPGETSRVIMGMESVDGVQAEKAQITYNHNGQSNSMYQWNAPGIPIPVKMSALDGSWSTEYRNIQVGAQPAVIFEPPQTYQKMQMPDIGGMMAQAFQDNQ